MEKLSDLIRKLEVLKEKHGDNQITFNVKDYFSKYGEDMILNLKVGEDEKGLDWFGSKSGNGYTTLNFNLCNKEGKNAKITYRK